MKTKRNHVSHKDFAIHISVCLRILTFLLTQGPSGFGGDRRGGGDCAITVGGAGGVYSRVNPRLS